MKWINYKELNGSIFQTSFIASIVIGFITYGVAISEFSISIDTEYSFFSWGSESLIWWMSLGRWGMAIYDYILKSYPYTPFLTHVVSVFYLSVATAISSSLIYNNKKKAVIYSMALMSFPQFAYQMEFSQQAEIVSFGILTSSLSVYFFVHAEVAGKRFKYYSLSVLLFTLSIGIYQSLIVIPFIIYISHLLEKVIEKKHASDLHGEACRFAIISAISSLLYFVIYLITKHIFLNGFSSYLKSTILWANGDYLLVIKNIYTIVINAYAGKLYAGGETYSLVIFIFLIGCIKILTMKFTKKERTLLISLLTLLLLIPFTILFLLGSIQSPRVLIGLSQTFAFFMAFTITLTPINRNNIQLALFFIACILSLKSASTVNTLFYSDVIARKIDSRVSEQIISKIKEVYGINSLVGERVFFVGNYRSHNPWIQKESSTFGASLMGFDGSDFNRIRYYLHINEGVILTPPDEQNKMDIEEALLLPSWPNIASIKKINNVIYVNLG